MKTASTRRAGSAKKIARPPAVSRFDFKGFLTSTGAGRSTAKYRSKETVFRQGADADAVYYIEKGKIHLVVVSEYGRMGIVARLRDGEFFGEACLAHQPLHLASAIAVAPSVVVKIEKDAMIRILHEQPKLSGMFMSFLLSRNIRSEADLIAQLFNSSERRLARMLLLLANFGKAGKMEHVIPPVSRETLAAKVGTTPAKIDFFMNKFRKLGLIEYDSEPKRNGGGLKVHTSLLNVIVHD